MLRRRLIMTPLLAFLAGTALMANTWPHWRGPTHNGVSAETNLPVSWGAECRGPGLPKTRSGSPGRWGPRRRATLKAGR